MSSADRSDELRARQRELISIIVAARDDDSDDAAAAASTARDELVELMQGFVTHLAVKFAGPGPHVEDLVQAGNIGLLAAIDGYDPSYGAALTTFALKHIRGEMRKQRASDGWSMRVPRAVQDLAIAIDKQSDSLEETLGRQPTVRELAAHLDVTTEAILDALEASRTREPKSLDAPVHDDGRIAAEVFGAEDREFGTLETREAVAALLEVLPDREKDVIRLQYFDGLRQAQVAERLGISQAHVSRLDTHARATMRGYVDA